MVHRWGFHTHFGRKFNQVLIILRLQWTLYFRLCWGAFWRFGRSFDTIPTECARWTCVLKDLFVLQLMTIRLSCLRRNALVLTFWHHRPRRNVSCTIIRYVFFYSCRAAAEGTRTPASVSGVSWTRPFDLHDRPFWWVYDVSHAHTPMSWLEDTGDCAWRTAVNMGRVDDERKRLRCDGRTFFSVYFRSPG